VHNILNKPSSILSIGGIMAFVFPLSHLYYRVVNGMD